MSNSDKNTLRKVQRSVAALCAGIESHAARRAVHVLHELSADQAAAACIKRAGGQVRLERLLKASEANVRGEGGDPLSTLNTVRLGDACRAILSRLSGVGSERRPAVKSSAYGRPPPNARAAQKPRGATLGDYLEVAVQRSSSASSSSPGKAKRDTGQDARPQPLAVIEASAAERPCSPASRRASRQASLGSQISPSAECAAAARAEQYTSRVRRARAENMSRLREGIKRSSVGVAVAPC